MLEQLQKEKEIAIFGAGIVAVEVGSVLTGEPYNLSVSCFMVSRLEENPTELFGQPVISIDKARDILSKDVQVIIASMEKSLDEIIEILHKKGFFNLIPLTFESDLWSYFRGNYFMEYCFKLQKKYLKLEDELLKVKDKGEEKDICIYSAKCHVDKELHEDLSCYSWEIPIQVGAELTQKIICNVRDNQGDNISGKNKQYCELTALYWIWKNTQSKYAGLCHYRRHFDLNNEQICQLAVSDIDVVLTIPILNFPSVGDIYKKDHIIGDWTIMMEGIGKICPEYLTKAQEIQNGSYYYAYNMFIAKKSIFDDYCQWLFTILEYCEKYCEKKDNVYQNRYIGFLAERLLTIYMTYHENQYKIAHAKKHFVNN